MQTLVISTSPRKGSNSLRVANALAHLSQEAGGEVKSLDFEAYDLPLVGQGGLKKDQLSDFQAKLIESLTQAQVILLAVPEYNWTTSGQLINAIHQLGNPDFGHVFDNKLFALVGVSSGRGGRIPCLEMTTLLNKMISFLNKQSIVSPRIFESHETPQNLDEQGQLLSNELYNKGLRDFVAYTFRLAQRWFAA
ncbi:MAG: NAD(P)H-dependent oxidoreductase [Microscillaceae bacterium]|nr:NAD(P)H-dependent oxidoreductase [Microscillaceae bacterium]